MVVSFDNEYKYFYKETRQSDSLALSSHCEAPLLNNNVNITKFRLCMHTGVNPSTPELYL